MAVDNGTIFWEINLKLYKNETAIYNIISRIGIFCS